MEREDKERRTRVREQESEDWASSPFHSESGININYGMKTRLCQQKVLDTEPANMSQTFRTLIKGDGKNQLYKEIL